MGDGDSTGFITFLDGSTVRIVSESASHAVDEDGIMYFLNGEQGYYAAPPVQKIINTEKNQQLVDDIVSNLHDIIRMVRSDNFFIADQGSEAERNLQQLEVSIMLLRVREVDPNLWLGIVKPSLSYLLKKVGESALDASIGLLIGAALSAITIFASR